MGRGGLVRRTYSLGLFIIVLLIGCLCGDGGEDVTLFTLTVERQGEGTVVPNVGPHTYDKGTMVELTAAPADDWGFSHWDGPVADRESAQTQVLMDLFATTPTISLSSFTGFFYMKASSQETLTGPGIPGTHMCSAKGFFPVWRTF